VPKHTGSQSAVRAVST